MKKAFLLALMLSVNLFPLQRSSEQGIFDAVRSGRLDSVRALIELDPQLVNERDGGQRTPLHWAARKGDPEILEYLIKKGADPNALDEDKATPLVNAVANGHRALVKMLIDAGSDVNLRNVFGMSALHYAVRNNYVEESRLIISKGADLNSKIYDGKTALHLACQGGKTDILGSLMAGGAKAAETDRGGNSPLHTAVYYGDLKAVEILLEHKAETKAKNKLSQTPLHQAAALGYGEIARLLLSRGGRVEEKDDKGHTPLDLARIHNNKKLADLLSPYYEQKNISSGTEDAKTRLKRKLRAGEAIIWHLGNCGWAVKTKSKLLVFDYWNYGAPPDEPSLGNGRLSKDELKGLDIYFFVSHGHYDHYDKSIFDFESSARIRKYIFGWKASDNPKYVYLDENRSNKAVDGIEVSNIFFNPESGFLVRVDGVSIYHGGDYAGHFREDFDYLSKKRNQIDILFSDYEYHEDVCIYSIEKLNPKVMFPMHQDGCEYLLKEEAERLSLRFPKVKCVYIENRGDCFFYGHAGIQER